MDFEANKNRFTDYLSDEAVDEPNECWNSTFTNSKFRNQLSTSADEFVFSIQCVIQLVHRRC